jgi:hypothetical protein
VRGTLKPAAAFLVVGAIVALTAGSAGAAVRMDRPHAATPVRVPAAVRTLVQRLESRATVLARPQAARVLRTKHRQRTLQAHSTFGGFAYCAYDFFGEGNNDFITWPVQDSGHTAVLTISSVVRSSSADFTSGNTVQTNLWWAIQYGGSLYLYNSEAAAFEVGPVSYSDAWIGWSFIDPTGPWYYALINDALFYDNGTWSSPSQYFAPVFGPKKYNSTSCAY